MTALEGLTAICSQQSDYLHLHATSSSGNLLSKDTLICVILRHLLELSSHENDSDVRAACACCLGGKRPLTHRRYCFLICEGVDIELGALDPAKIGFVLNPTGRSRTLDDDGSRHPPPWTLGQWEFSLLLIEKYLVPGLRVVAGNVYAQDRICFAIQVSYYHKNLLLSM